MEHIQTPSQVEGLIGLNHFIVYYFTDSCVGLDKEINKFVCFFSVK